MYVAAIVPALLIAALSAAGQSSRPGALEVLRYSYPSVNWKAESSKVADVNCDGKPDTVVLGSQKDDAAVGIVWGTQRAPAQLFTFPIGKHMQNSFCSMPTNIEVSPLDCESDEGTLPGCKQYHACKAFSVVDDDCDSFHFYWDSSRKTLVWWRL
jgi:hypothetical protein